MFVTYDLLKEHGACEDGLKWFKDNYPNGCELSEVQDAPSEFVWWFYNNVQQDNLLYRLCGVNRSNGVNHSYGVNYSDGVNHSNGVNGSNGVYGSFGISNSFGVNNALFMANKPHTYSIFGREVSRERFSEVKEILYDKLNGWRPTFNNIKALYLANGSDWKLTSMKDAEEISKKEAWASMPKEAVEYVKSLPEYDAEMFREITGIEGDETNAK